MTCYKIGQYNDKIKTNCFKNIVLNKCSFLFAEKILVYNMTFVLNNILCSICIDEHRK